MVSPDSYYADEICKVGEALHRLGYCPATSGNISVRLDRWRIMITPTGVSKSGMSPYDMVIISPEGQHRYGRKRASSELPMHLQIYNLRPDIHAVVHAHPMLATAFACAGVALDQPISSETQMAVGKVPIAKYGTPGTPDLPASLEHLIPHHVAILMGNHGVVTYGKDLAEAHGRMDIVEHFAGIVQGTYKIGSQVELTSPEIEKLNVMTKRYSTGGKTSKWD